MRLRTSDILAYRSRANGRWPASVPFRYPDLEAKIKEAMQRNKGQKDAVYVDRTHDLQIDDEV